jgi:hypothetical protein
MARAAGGARSGEDRATPHTADVAAARRRLFYAAATTPAARLFVAASAISPLPTRHERRYTTDAQRHACYARQQPCHVICRLQ